MGKINITLLTAAITQVCRRMHGGLLNHRHESGGVENPREQRRTNLDFGLGVIVDDVLYLSP